MKTLLHYITIFICSLAAVAVASCSGEDAPEPDKTVRRTVLVYMIADNSLGDYGTMADTHNLSQMKKAAKAGAIKDGRLLVFHDPAGADSSPRLIEITAQGEQELKVYGTTVSSTDPDFMRSVFDDAASLAPALDRWLVLWSHGTGWIESADSRSTVQASPQSFGQDKNPVRSEMKITTLASALGTGRFSLIYFDCCFMGCVEALYELRHAADVIVASPTELPIEGMPYDTNIPVMFSTDCTGEKMAQNTLNYYLYESGVSTRSCTMVVVNTAALDGLAAATRSIMETGATAPYSYYGVPFYRRNGVNSRTHDMGHYINSLSVDPSLLTRWNAAYNNAVTYSGATPVCYGLDMSEFTGLGCYIVRSSSDADIDGYRNQSWWKDVVTHNPSLN